MISFIQDGIRRIKDTRKYAREKNVPNWYYNMIGAIMLTFIACTIITLYSIIFVSIANPNKILLHIFGSTVKFYPFILTFFLMIRYGHHIIKFLILLTSYFQKGIMKSINYLDMYLWKKTGKDSIISNFIVKHGKIVKMIIYIPIILNLILQYIPKH